MQLADASGVPQNTLSRNLLITTVIRSGCIQTFDLDVPRLGSSRSIFGTTIPRTVLAPLYAPLWTERAGQFIRQKTRRLAASRSSEDRHHAKSAFFSAAAVGRAPNRS